MDDIIELRIGITVIEFINKYSTLKYDERKIFVTYLKNELSAFDDNFSFIFDNLMSIFEYEKNIDNIENVISNFIDVYKLNKTNVELCIKCCLDYLNDYLQEINI